MYSMFWCVEEYHGKLGMHSLCGRQVQCSIGGDKAKRLQHMSQRKVRAIQLQRVRAKGQTWHGLILCCRILFLWFVLCACSCMLSCGPAARS